MCWNLYNCQFKASGYNHGSTYLKTRLTTNQTHTTDSQKPKKKELKHTTKENHQVTMGETEQEVSRKSYKGDQKASNKIVVITNLSMFILNERDRMLHPPSL